VDSRLLEQLVREIRTQGTKGKVPVPHAELQGNMDPKLDLSSHVMRTFVGYATAPGSLADAGNAQCPNNSPFTYALKDCLKNREIASQVIQAYLKYFWEEWRLRQVLLFIYTHHCISGHSGDFKGTCIFLDDIRSKV
jgi:hypothetical protein